MAWSRGLGAKYTNVVVKLLFIVILFNSNYIKCASLVSLSDYDSPSLNTTSEFSLETNASATNKNTIEQKTTNETSLETKESLAANTNEVVEEILNETSKETKASPTNKQKTTDETNLEINDSSTKIKDVLKTNETDVLNEWKDDGDSNHHILDLRKRKGKKINNLNKYVNDVGTNKTQNKTIVVLDDVLNFDDDARNSDAEIWTKFRWLMELFDHHKFDTKNLKDTSVNCSRDMLVYLKALRRGETWAAKMYDASGHYNGQFFFGNNFWIGSKGLCRELHYNITLPFAQDMNEHLLKTPPFDTSFSTVVIQVILGIYTPQIRTILLGVCMPLTCTTRDITAMLESDGRDAEILANDKMAALHNRNGGHTHIYEDDKISLKVSQVRSVPGPYDVWTDTKFLILCGVTSITLAVIILATFYEAYINHKNQELLLKEANTAQELVIGKRGENNNQIKAMGEVQEAVKKTNGFGKIHATNGHNGHRPSGEPTDRSDRRIKRSSNGNGRLNGNCESIENGMETNLSIDERPVNDAKCSVRITRYGEGLFSQILLCFSVLSNTGSIMRTDDNQADSINCIHGLRFLSLGWVIMVHTYLSMFSVADNKTLRAITERNFFYQTVGNASYSVDTFFFISGLLLTYLYQKILETKRKNHLKKYEKLRLDQTPSVNHLIHQQTNGNQSKIYYNTNSERIHEMNKALFQRRTFWKEAKENIQEFCLLLFNRFIRLSPPYLFVIGLNMLSLKYVYNNSVFEPVIKEHISCDKYWWRNILYINNFFPGEEMCMKWSWYMANDTQFYIIGIFLMILSKRHVKLSLVLMGVLIVISWLVTGYISVTNNYRAKIQLPFELFDKLYIKPWTRLGPYMVGMLTGWYLWRWNGRIVLPMWVLIIGWPSALSLMGIIIYGMKDGYLDIWPTALYISVGHTAWSVALSWVVICCVAHRGGIISQILSYRGVFPLSRLAYCAYLVHVTVILYTTYSLDGPIHMHNGIVLVIYAGLCVMSYLLSFVVSLCFEVPIVRLLKINYSSIKNKNA